MKKVFSSHYLICLALIIGVSQYALVAVDIIATGGQSLWEVESDILISSGFFRYIKDIFLLMFSISWVIIFNSLPSTKNLQIFINNYFYWLITIILIGVIGFLLGYSPIFFLPSGLRWIMLLHVSMGIFIFSSLTVLNRPKNIVIMRYLWTIALADLALVFIQFRSISSIFDLAFGESRLTGFFANAGVAGSFAICICMVTMVLDGVNLKTKLLYSVICAILGLSSGSRFSVFACSVIILSQLYEFSDYLSPLKRKIIRIFLSIFTILTAPLAYVALNDQVGRGDAITQQFEEGGRAYNFSENINLLLSSNPIEFLVGRGLGIGTNTAFSYLKSEEIDPDIFRFNLLTDNVFITSMFQFGLLGSIVFWSGIVSILMLVLLMMMKWVLSIAQHS